MYVINARKLLKDMLKKEEIYFGKKSKEYYNLLVNRGMDDNYDSKHCFDVTKLILIM